jgi:hypothetical protein
VLGVTRVRCCPPFFRRRVFRGLLSVDLAQCRKHPAPVLLQIHRQANGRSVIGVFAQKFPI